jgi:hypothetical protein
VDIHVYPIVLEDSATDDLCYNGLEVFMKPSLAYRVAGVLALSLLPAGAIEPRTVSVAQDRIGFSGAQKAAPIKAAQSQRSAVTTVNSGATIPFALPSVSSPSLYSGDTYKVDVPANATRLEIRVRTTTPNADVDLFVRYGSPVEMASGSVVRDHEGVSDTGNETVVITPTSNPALRAGEYHFTLALFTTGIEVTGTITATVATGAATPEPTLTGKALTPDTTVALFLPAVENSTLLRGDFSYRLTVPADVRRFSVRLTPANSGTRMGLYVRAGQDVALSEGRVVADYLEVAPNTITVTRPDSAVSRAETYYIAYSLLTAGATSRALLTASLDAVGHLPELQANGSTTFRLDSVSTPILFNPLGRFQVPVGATRIEIRVTTATPNADVDVFTGRNRIPNVLDGNVHADYISNGTASEEVLVVTADSMPTLAPGWYALSLGTWTTGVEISGSVNITVR